MDLIGFHICTEDEISTRLKSKLNALRNGFFSAFSPLKAGYDVLLGQGKKGQLSFVYISFLRSSVAAKRPLFRIDLYDSQGLSDIQECAGPWDIGCVGNRIYTDLPLPKYRVIGHDKPQAYEVEWLWMEDAEKYFRCLRQFITEIILPARELAPSSTTFLYGEYMDKSSPV